MKQIMTRQWQKERKETVTKYEALGIKDETRDLSEASIVEVRTTLMNRRRTYLLMIIGVWLFQIAFGALIINQAW